MKISDLDWLLQQEESGLKLGKNIEEAFPKLNTLKLSGGFFEPAQCLLRFLVWLWLCEIKQEREKLKVVAAEILNRSLELYAQRVQSNDRDRFEFLLLCGCEAMGDLNLAKLAANKVEMAQPDSSTYRICASILKSRILNPESQETEQFSILEKLSGTPPPVRVGERSLWKAFVERNNEALKREVGKSCKKYTRALLKNCPPHERMNDMVVMGYWPLNSFWPWAELVLLKLAFGPKKAPSLDEFWIPEGLLRRSNGA